MSEPTDMELMMFADGELDEARRTEVAAYLDRSKDARLKLSAMDVVGELVRRDADRLATAYRADDIVASVLAKVDTESLSSSDEATTEARRASGVREVSKTSPTKAPFARTAPANDNARFIYGLAALAAAAAFALWMWGNGSRPGPLPPNEGPVAAAPTAQAPMPVAAESQATPGSTAASKSADTEAASDSSDPGVQVASINWGETKPGAVYYVPADAQGATTTVVWLAAE